MTIIRKGILRKTVRGQARHSRFTSRRMSSGCRRRRRDTKNRRNSSTGRRYTKSREFLRIREGQGARYWRTWRDCKADFTNWKVPRRQALHVRRATIRHGDTTCAGITQASNGDNPRPAQRTRFKSTARRPLHRESPKPTNLAMSNVHLANQMASHPFLIYAEVVALKPKVCTKTWRLVHDFLI